MAFPAIKHVPYHYAQTSWIICASSNVRFGLLLLLISYVGAQLPYNPTYLLRSSKNNGAYVYLLEPPSTTNAHGQLLAIDNSTSLTSNNLSSITVSKSLPFLEDDSSVAYIPTLDPDGAIVVYSGNCTRGANGASLWKFTPSSDNATGKWEKETYHTQDLKNGTIFSGTNFLAGVIQFSPNTSEADSSIYYFGGMCPSTNSTHQTWTSAATYSNELLQFHNSEISLSSPAQTQPIQEAGFSTTALSPTYSNASDVLIAQQNFLLLGGQSGAAFINMSEVALLSLPQENWIYESVNTPNSSSSIVEPRSGHTATLTADGTRVVVIGGWVGDVSTPASPQLAILDLGLGYGGLGDWSWTLPSSTDSPFSTAGIYGHGAILLDRDVIFVAGGYDIPAVSSRSKRATQTTSARNFFYNTSSEQWLSGYDTAQVSTSGNATKETAGLLSTNSEKIGLGIGLALGLLGLILALLGCFFARRSKSKRNHHRNEAEKSGSMTNTAYTQQEQHYEDTDEEVKEDVMHEAPAASLWDRRQRTRDSWSWIPSNEGESQAVDGWGSTGAREAERTGVDVDIPSPRRGLRRSMYGSFGRNGYRAAAFLDDDPPTGYGNMYAIEERSEEGSTPSSRKASANQSHARPPSALLDTFNDSGPTLIATPAETQHMIPRKPVPPTPYLLGPRPRATHASPGIHPQPNVSTWIRDWAAPDTLLPHGPNNSPPKSGRSSPAKSERTSSVVSVRSQHTVHSAISPNASPVRTRENRRSIRYYFPGLFNGFAGSISVASSSPSRSTFAENNSRPNTSGQRENGSRPNTSGNQDTTSPPLISNRTTDADSFNTAHSYVSSIHQDESDTLLGSPSSPYPKLGTILEPDTEPTFTRHNSSPSGERSRSQSRSRTGGIVGNVRRIVSPRAMSFVSDSRSEGRRITSLTGITSTIASSDETAHAYARLNQPEKSSTFPADVNLPTGDALSKSIRNAVVRRSVSDSATIARSKRGTDEWEFGSSSSPPESVPHRSVINSVDTMHLLPPAPISNRSRGSSPSANPNRTLSPSSIAQAIRAERRRSGRSAVSGRSGRTSVMSGISGESDGDVEWDVGTAIEERVVHQLISAVPRERLRVVNSDPIVGRWELGRGGGTGSGMGSGVVER